MITFVLLILSKICNLISCHKNVVLEEKLRNLIGDKQKREIISYAKENPKLTQQQIADNLTIKWDLFIVMSLYKCKMHVS